MKPFKKTHPATSHQLSVSEQRALLYQQSLSPRWMLHVYAVANRWMVWKTAGLVVSDSYFNTVGDAVVLIVFATSMPGSMFASKGTTHAQWMQMRNTLWSRGTFTHDNEADCELFFIPGCSTKWQMQAKPLFYPLLIYQTALNEVVHFYLWSVI